MAIHAANRFETILLRDYGQDALRLREILDTLSSIGEKTTKEHIELFCMMFFVEPIHLVTDRMRRYANLCFKTWESTGSVNPQWASNYLMKELETRLDIRDGIGDYRTHKLENLRTKLATTELLTSLDSRLNDLYAAHKQAPTPVVERTCWGRKIRIQKPTRRKQ